MTEVRQLAIFVQRLQWDHVPEEVRKTVRNVVIDSVGVGVGACRNEQNLKVIEEFERIEKEEKSVGIWGQGKKTSLLSAVFLNAIEGHTLELDDVHTNSKTHIGTVVVPAAWSMAEYHKKTGKELLLAVLCAYEVVSRIGMALGVSAHRNLGWHATATAGIFGSAVACGKLLGLTADELVHAMGMAGQSAGGTWAFLEDGASCKVLNPAVAAVNGARCALLAKSGMTGPEHVLTTKDGGMLAAMSNDYAAELAAKDLGLIWEVLHMDNKPYPCCRSTHCTIDGALYLKKKHSINAEDVDKAEVYTYLVGNKQCGMSPGSIKPKVPVEAKFSTPFTVANALLFGRVGLKEFEQENINNAEVQELLSRVKVITEDSFTEQYPKHWGCRVKIFCKDGSVYETTVQDASGSVNNPLTEEQLLQKISGLLYMAMPEASAEKLLKQLLNLEHEPVVWAV